MKKTRLKIDWNSKSQIPQNFDSILIKYKSYLKSIVLRDSTLDSYIGCVGRYLIYIGSDRPSEDDFLKFYGMLHERHFSRSTGNNYSFAIRNFYQMLGENISVQHLKENGHIPYYFNEEDVIRIFSVCHNIQTPCDAPNTVLWLSESF
jgi:hypothetical protein